MIDVIQEYLVSLGFDVDKKSVQQSKETIATAVQGISAMIAKEMKAASDKSKTSVLSLDKLFEGFMEGIKKNKAIQTFTNNAIGAASRFANTVKPMIAEFVASSKFLITGAIAGISAAFVALGAAVVGVIAKIMADAAKADIKVQIFARRLFTTVENARSLQAVMKQLGVSDIEGLNDIAFNPELRKQFIELRKLAGSLELGSNQREGFKNIRALGFEFQKLGLIMDYFWQRLGGDLGKVLEGPLKSIQGIMAGFNRFLTTTLPEVSGILAHTAGIIGNLLDIALRLVGIIFQIPDLSKGLVDFLKEVNDELALLDAILGAIGRFLDKFNLSQEKGKKIVEDYQNRYTNSPEAANYKVDLFKVGQGFLEKIAYYLQKIWELLSFVWNTLGRWLMDRVRDVQKVGETISQGAEWIANPIGKGVAESVKAGQALGKSLQEGKLDRDLNKSSTLNYLLDAAKKLGLIVTSTTGGRHNKGSLHYTGEAIDVDHKSITPKKIAALEAMGIRVRDERTHPAGQAVWGGSHYHLSFRASQLAQMLKRQQAAPAPQSMTPTVAPGEKRVEGRIAPQISIYVNGAGNPIAVANEVSQRLAMTTRGLQGALT